ncbi:MAG: biopolymer transporter ExbD [Bacteroidales bacterium]|nr:biopolymer transporter ExbD [Bacteroidales bacterium]
MALKQRNKVDASFSMSSMTDIIFLLLLFFMIASTMSSPNDMRIKLPQSKTKTSTKAHVVRLSIDQEGQYAIADQNETPRNILFEDLEAELQAVYAQDTAVFVALHADENVPYKEVVKVLDVVNENKLKLVIATRRVEE